MMTRVILNIVCCFFIVDGTQIWLSLFQSYTKRILHEFMKLTLY